MVGDSLNNGRELRFFLQTASFVNKLVQEVEGLQDVLEIVRSISIEGCQEVWKHKLCGENLLDNCEYFVSFLLDFGLVDLCAGDER